MGDSHLYYRTYLWTKYGLTHSFHRRIIVSNHRNERWSSKKSHETRPSQSEALSEQGRASFHPAAARGQDEAGAPHPHRDLRNVPRTTRRPLEGRRYFFIFTASNESTPSTKIKNPETRLNHSIVFPVIFPFIFSKNSDRNNHHTPEPRNTPSTVSDV